MNIIKYKGYEGTAEIDMEKQICRGKILFINDLITYEAKTPVDLENEFKATVDDYIETCEDLGREPQKPMKGVFNVRISPDLHKKAVVSAMKEGIKLNSLVGKAIELYVNGSQKIEQTVNINIAGEEGGSKTITAQPSLATTWREVSSVVQ